MDTLGSCALGCALHTRLPHTPEPHSPSLEEACRHQGLWPPALPQEPSHALRKESEAAVMRRISDQGPAASMLSVRTIFGPTLAAVAFPGMVTVLHAGSQSCPRLRLCDTLALSLYSAPLATLLTHSVVTA